MSRLAECFERRQIQRRFSNSTVSSAEAEQVVADNFRSEPRAPPLVGTSSSNPTQRTQPVLVAPASYNLANCSDVKFESQVTNVYNQSLLKDPTNPVFFLNDKKNSHAQKTLFILGQKWFWGGILLITLLITAFNSTFILFTLGKTNELIDRLSMDIGKVNPEVPPAKLPYHAVIITHTEDEEGTCVSKSECINRVRRMYHQSIENGFLDIPYNFLVGGDGRMYEGRGYRYQGQFPNASVSNFEDVGMIVAFIGTFNINPPDSRQIRTFKAFLEDSIKRGGLSESYHVLSQFELLMMESQPDGLLMMLNELAEYHSLTKVISRHQWGSLPPKDESENEFFTHQRNVSAARLIPKDYWCNDVENCIEKVQQLQIDEQLTLNDIRYSFIVGSHGVFEGRGWDIRPDPGVDRDFLSNGFLSNNIHQKDLEELWERLIKDGQVLGKITQNVNKAWDIDPSK